MAVAEDSRPVVEEVLIIVLTVPSLARVPRVSLRLNVGCWLCIPLSKLFSCSGGELL
jgi:hypothetical protein